MSFWGMNTEQVLDSADAVEHAAGQLDEILDQVHAVTMSAPWQGPDADDFRGRWQQVRMHGEVTVLPELRSRARLLAQHVQEQDRASDEDGSSGSWDGVADFFRGDGDGAAELVDTVGGVQWLAERAGERFDALVDSAQQAWDGVTDYVSTVGGAFAESITTHAGMIGKLLDTGRWPSLSELVIGGLHDKLRDPGIGLLEDGTGYAAEPQRVTPGHDGAPDLRDPTSVADIVHNTNASYGDKETGEISMTVVRDGGGEVTGVVANVPGTEKWGPFAGDNPMDLTGNAAQAGPAGHSAGAEATAHAISQLYADHGIPPGTPLMISGHSQGGMIGSSLAADPAFASQHDLTTVMSYGAPVDNYSVNPAVNYLHFEHAGDPVPLIDGEGYPFVGPDPPNVQTVTMPGPHDGLSIENHKNAAYYDSIAGTGDTHRGGMDDFLVDAGGSADHYTSSVHRDN